MKERPGTTLARRVTGNHSTMWLVVAIYLGHHSISAQNAAGNRHMLAQYQEGANVSVVTADVRCFSGRTAAQYRSAKNAK